MTYSREAPPTADRLVSTYEDLASKHFEIVADFESPEQASMFRVETPDSPGAVRFSTERARPETGTGSLKMTFIDSKERIVAQDRTDAQWSLVRDWSKYQLLLMSVFTPRKLGTFQVNVRSGTDVPLTYTASRIMLNPGWNLVRIDLGDLQEEVNLADMRALGFGCDPLETPVELYLDDVVLVDNTRQVFGPTEPRDGELYVRSEGRRIAVGAGGRFEVIFSRGQIRQWYDLGMDTSRLHNLAGRGSLGPAPVVVPAEGSAKKLNPDDPSAWAGLGVAVAVHQALAEVTPLYARVEGQLRFGSVDSPPDDNSPAHRWIYSIYRDGRIYVECSGTARTDNFNPPGIGMAFSCDSSAGFRRELAQSQPALAEEGQEPRSSSYCLFTRPQRNAADFLIIPSAPMAARSIDNAGESRSGVLWLIPGQEAGFGFAALMKVWPADIDSPAQADPIAEDYQKPLPIGLEVGHLGRTDPGDFDGDGFSEARGYYVLQLDGSTARVRIPAQPRLRFAPMFKVLDVGNRDVWAYLDGKQVKDMQRDADGNVLFIVPGVISREALLEITSRAHDADKPGETKK